MSEVSDIGNRIREAMARTRDENAIRRLDMPRVGGKNFPYTKSGKAAAKKEREEMKKKPKKGKKGY